jgi:Peptidase family C25
VLLVGGDTYDYKGYTSNSAISFIPTVYGRTHAVVNYAPLDSAFADINGDGRADVAVGRFPVRTLAEARNAVSKTLAYTSNTPGGRALMISDRESSGFNFRDMNNSFGDGLGAAWNKLVIALDSYAVGATVQARADVAAAINQGVSLVSFFGHSSPSSWTREGLLTANTVNGGMFSNSTMPTVVTQWGCWATYFVDPTYNTISHALLLQNAGGAAAMLGASGLTDVSSDIAFANRLLPKLGNGERMGDALKQSQLELQATQPTPIDVTRGGTLLGDPALKVKQ